MKENMYKLNKDGTLSDEALAEICEGVIESGFAYTWKFITTRTKELMRAACRAQHEADRTSRDLTARHEAMAQELERQMKGKKE